MRGNPWFGKIFKTNLQKKYQLELRKLWISHTSKPKSHPLILFSGWTCNDFCKTTCIEGPYVWLKDNINLLSQNILFYKGQIAEVGGIICLFQHQIVKLLTAKLSSYFYLNLKCVA